MATTNPLIVIVGETASGKSALALDIAKKYNGSIIAADSRTVYKGMDIGTAKPSLEEQKAVPHYCLDIVTPAETFSVADFKAQAERAIIDVREQGRLPIMVGGTGLYIDAVLYDYEFRAKAPAEVRERLLSLSVAELQQEISDRKLDLPKNNQNPRHLMRVLETNGQSHDKALLREDTLLLGLQIDREVLKKRIEMRVEQMINAGFIDELIILSKKYNWDVEALRAPGYRAFQGYIEGRLSLDQAKELFVHNDMQLAKRQRTWFKRNKSIQWLDNPNEAFALIENFLSK